MFPGSQLPADLRKDTFRSGRAGAVRLFNELALEFGVGTLSCRPSASAVTELWCSVCEEALPQHMEKLTEARAMWLDHHGTGQLLEDLMPDSGAAPSQLDTGELLEGHRMVTDPKDAGRSQAKMFRLKSKAFLLTFNSKDFCGTETLWSTFRDWINGQVKRTHTIQWSAAMESSSHSTRTGTVHLHAYFSWTGKQNKGVNVRGLDEWCFQGVRPRVDCNSEARGPIFWLKAVQRGHFYCSAHKEGALFSATNYPPWTGVWVPETAYVVSLYRQHKLGHDRYLSLSAMLRDGHDRRQASVAAVKITEVAEAFQAERAWAREQILKKSLPFKPLPASIENWMMSYAEVGERYRMLVLYGPSCTGKTRLARSLFGEGRTLVVDVQHAEHPDLHGFRRHHHLAVVLDEVAKPAFIAENKKLLQAHVDGAILGQSATQLYTYEIFLWRVPIILTINNWDLSGLAADQREWIETNCVAVNIAEPVFEKSVAPRKRFAADTAASTKSARATR